MQETVRHHKANRREVLAVQIPAVVACVLSMPLLSKVAPARAADGDVVVIRPDLKPNLDEYDTADASLKEVSRMFEEALDAPNVSAEERLWTQVIEKYGPSDANWAPDASCRAYGNRGNARSRQGKFKEAIEDYNKAFELCPYSSDPVLNRGVAYEVSLLVFARPAQPLLTMLLWSLVSAKALGKYDLALQDYTAVLKVDVSDPAAWNNFGNAQAGLGHWDAAADAYKKASSLVRKSKKHLVLFNIE